jgi:hypothetical protein
MRIPALFGLALLIAACVDDKPTTSLAAGAGAGGNVVATFNQDSGCNGWDPSGATFTLDPAAKSGAGACRMCWDGTKDSDGNGYAFANLFVKTEITPGAHYTLSLYLRSIPDQPPLENVQVAFSGIDENQSGLDEQDSHASLSTTWGPTAAELTVMDPKTKSLHVLIQGQQPAAGAGHGCLAFDDVVITRK